MHGPLPHVVDASLPLCALPAFSLNIICPSCICQHFVFPDVHFVIEQTTELKTRSAMSAFSEWWRHRSWKYACDCLQVDIGAWLALLLSSYTLVLVFFLLAEKLTVTTKLVTIHAHIFRVPSLWFNPSSILILLGKARKLPLRFHAVLKCVKSYSKCKYRGPTTRPRLLVKVASLRVSSEDCGDHRFSSSVFDWPLARASIGYWRKKKLKAQLHFTGNVVSWCGGLASLCLLTVYWLVVALARKRRIYIVSEGKTCTRFLLIRFCWYIMGGQTAALWALRKIIYLFFFCFYCEV